MLCKCHVAMWAARRVAAGAALQIGGIATAILEQDDLLATHQRAGDIISKVEVEVGLSLATLHCTDGVRDDNLW